MATADDALVYTSGGGLQTEVRLPFTGRGWLADPSGSLVQRLDANGGRLAVALDKSQYASRASIAFAAWTRYSNGPVAPVGRLRARRPR